MLSVRLGCYLAKPVDNIPVVVAQLGDPSVHLLSHGVYQVRTCLVLSKISKVKMNSFKDFEEILIIDNRIKTCRVLLNNCQNSSRLQGVFGHCEKGIHEILLSQDTLLVIVQAFELI